MRLSHCAALGYRHLGLSELVDHLLRRMSLLGNLSPFQRPDPNIVAGPASGGAGHTPWRGLAPKLKCVCPGRLKKSLM